MNSDPSFEPLYSQPSLLSGLQRLSVAGFVFLIGWKSIEPIKESLSPSPWLRTYDQYYTVNSYGNQRSPTSEQTD